MASIADLLKAKDSGADDENKKSQKKVKLSKVKLIADEPKKNNNYGRKRDSYVPQQKKQDVLPTIKTHAAYVTSMNIAQFQAKAPYNFVPFTSTVLPSPLNEQPDDFKGYLTHQKTYSGNIQLTLKNLTPLFIGDGSKDGSKDFFSPAGMPIIPGSSLRGMVRSLFKIITAGTMRPGEDFVDRHLYYRCLMAPKSMPWLNELHESYVNRMSHTGKDKTGKTTLIKNAKPGFLFRKISDKKYYIVSCELTSVKMDAGHNWGRNSRVVWDDKNKGAYIWTGNQRVKKYVRYLLNPDWNKEYPVPDAVIQDYRDDKNRRGVNLLDEKSQNTKVNGSARAFAQRDDIDFLAPCFFTCHDDLVTTFGHGRSYRIPYEHSVGDLLPKAHRKNMDVVDFAAAVFGDKDRWAGRVSFEDAILQNEPDFAAKEWVRPLMGANPTSFQMYLTQKNYPPAHWDSQDSGSTLRGYKLYWHKKISDKDWQALPAQRNDNITKRIRPLEPGQQFSSVIHFRQLTAIELGALLKVFHLADDEKDYDIVYKLGMGKSLGLGSVRINASLQLDDGGRYSSLFSGNTWKESAIDTDAASFIQEFDQYAAKHIEDKSSYQSSLNMLKIMLNWKNTEISDWNQNVMTAGANTDGKSIKGGKGGNGGVDPQFTKRWILPSPDNVIKKNK